MAVITDLKVVRKSYTGSPAVSRMADRTTPVVKLTLTLTLILTLLLHVYM